MLQRRRTDRPFLHDRRRGAIDRRATPRMSAGPRFPSRREQAVQFCTRYLFAVLGLAFFNIPELQPKWMTALHMNLIFGVYLLINTGNFVHAWHKPFAPTRFRFALWIDLALVTLCVLNDPYDIPPSMAAYIVVVLGNGMRYGMRFFAEALCGSLLLGGMAVTTRYLHFPTIFSPGTAFLCLFGAIIVVYAYILMSRVERARRRSEQVGRTDSLTGLLNRRGLNEAANDWLNKERQRDGTPVVMFADLDRFKSVNDTLGHAEGDRVLTKVAALLQEAVRSSDLIARYGGDEFVMLLSDANLSDVDNIAARIQKIVESWFGGSNLGCGISIGYAEVPPGDWNLDRVLLSADHLLYQSKAERKAQLELA